MRWEEVATVPASACSAAQRSVRRTIISRWHSEHRIRYRIDLKARMRVVHDDAVFRIAALQPDYAGCEKWILSARRTPFTSRLGNCAREGSHHSVE
ncbi:MULTISPECIES: head-tail adaptor protein [unclassified Caballeronia]|uniref:head-tail adaptor protein n=1 Tax=unclassified Caballeronia TaxID=2646786 RepID=UPI0032EEFFDE